MKSPGSWDAFSVSILHYTQRGIWTEERLSSLFYFLESQDTFRGDGGFLFVCFIAQRFQSDLVETGSIVAIHFGLYLVK